MHNNQRPRYTRSPRPWSRIEVDAAQLLTLRLQKNRAAWTHGVLRAVRACRRMVLPSPHPKRRLQCALHDDRRSVACIEKKARFYIWLDGANGRHEVRPAWGNERLQVSRGSKGGKVVHVDSCEGARNVESIREYAQHSTLDRAASRDERRKQRNWHRELRETRKKVAVQRRAP
jgi:hypothetical protein